MKYIRSSRTFFALTLTLLLAAGFAEAQRRGRNGFPKYDSATVVTLKGKVGAVTQHAGRRGWTGTHVSLKTEEGTFDVHLGPTSFLEEQGFKVAEGDELEVTGSRISYEGAEAVIAREVKRGGTVFTLRDQQGIPRWSRGRRRG